MIEYGLDRDGVATITWNMTEHPTNILTDKSEAAFKDAVEKAISDAQVVGIIIASKKKEFLAGADLDRFLGMTEPKDLQGVSERCHQMFRRLETGGKPVVAALNGTAFGGGYELALSCHHRIAADLPGLRLGLTEVSLGLLPGGGGTQRLSRLIGFEKALPLLLEGSRVDAQSALKLGMIDQIVAADTLLDASKEWILSGPEPSNPWDRKGFVPPGGCPDAPENAFKFAAANAMVHQKTYGNYPAPLAILSCVYEGLSSPSLDVGLRAEAKYFAGLGGGAVAQNLIRTPFFAVNRARKIRNRPKEVPQAELSKVSVLGAGMMGAGIAYETARAGFATTLLDSSLELAEKGKSYTANLLERQTSKGRLGESAAKEILQRIKPTVGFSDLQGSDLIIEAVFENRDIKKAVIAQAAGHINDDKVFASNTSTLPITGLAKYYKKPDRFIGLHFFSPVDKMQLVEVILGKETSQACLAHALDYVKAIRKVPILVNDSRGFYTSRVFSTYTEEGMALLQEGVNPALIENAGKMCGMPVGPLQVSDEVSLELQHKVRKQALIDDGADFKPSIGFDVLCHMVEDLGRIGRKAGQGFYDYEGGRKLWTGLAEEYPRASTQPDIEEVKQRLLTIQAIESARCLEENVLTNPTDADIGSVLGWGFPLWTGGTLSYVDTVGIEQFTDNCQRFADHYGERYLPPQLLLDMQKQKSRFHKR